MSMKGLFCGSFDPFTFGHLYVVKKALEICDELVICVGKNDEKMPLVPADTRVNLIKDVLQNAGITNVEVFADAGLMVVVAKKHCAVFVKSSYWICCNCRKRNVYKSRIQECNSK